MPNLTDEEVFTHVDSGEFIERYVDRFTSKIESDSVSVYDFDQMIFAEDGGDDVPDDIVWGAVQDFSKHIALLSDLPETESFSEIQQYLHQLNTHPTKQTVTAFFTYLGEHYTAIESVTENALIEIPDPTAPKIGEYPVVNVILYASPDGHVIYTVEATLSRSSFSVDDPESVFEHVGRIIPAGDIKQYSEEIYQSTITAYETELTFNVVPDLLQDSLAKAGYENLKDETVPDDVNPLYAGKSATYWQKEVWKVNGVAASSGFARVWYLPEEDVGVIQPSPGDFCDSFAIAKIKEELQLVDGKHSSGNSV